MPNLMLRMLGGFCIFFSCINPLPEKPTVFKQSIIFLYVMVTTCIFHVWIGQYFAFITVFGTLVLLYFTTSLKWLNLSCALFGYLFSVSVNYLFIGIMQKILNMSLGQINQNISIALSFSCFYFLVCYSFTATLGYIFRTILKISVILTSKPLCMGIFFNMVVVSILFVLNISYGETAGYGYGVIAFNGILFLVLFLLIAVLMYFLYRNIQQKQHARNMLTHYESLQDYTKKVEQLYGSMRSLKHDYVNILTTLSGYIENNDMSKLKTYFYQEVLPASQHFSESDHKLGLLSQIKIIELKSLFFSKMIYAMESGLTVEIELPDSIEQIPVNSIDLSRVLGIFLDNAVEAAAKSSEKAIRICLFKKDNSLAIMIRNSSTPPEFPISRLSDMGVSSNGIHRGIGLYNVKEILARYNNVVWDMEYKNPYFMQSLTIFYPRKDSI